ncbi:MAG: AtpZ/AtpI family protein [Cyclobacteriaceae bacterium]|nr:AtpZ/AtpI family protein [Cyclobacteriaceae bacterium]MDX5466221.1 AtpZ/AtpI family protein [Cyclobacteriaceae bacterium]
MHPDRQPKPPKSNQETPVYVKYIGLSFQLFAIIGGGTWLGWWVQQQSDMKFPVWILVFCFASIALAFYQLIKSMQQDK